MPLIEQGGFISIIDRIVLPNVSWDASDAA
jgi:hypothetical protein